MGNSNMSSEENQDMLESDFSNGLILLNIIFPEEVISNILTFVSWEDLRSCRFVCQSWKRLIDSTVSFEKMKMNMNYKSYFSGSTKKLNSQSLPFYVYYGIGKNAFGKNHLKNTFGSGEILHVCESPRRRSWSDGGQDTQICSDANCPRYKHWEIVSSRGDGWAVEATPIGSQPLPDQLEGRSCFVTSYAKSSKRQIIDLAKCGLNSKIMDEIRPHIEVSEWYAGRFDCGIIYKLTVSLLDANKEVLDQHSQEIIENHGDDDWHQILHTFKNYGPGVRFILFRHGGRDTQYWAGHYGSKMAGGSVIARIPEEFLQMADDPSQALNSTE
uniref:F-box domain-containing protein n=1 Tax=Graphocephala atropunctata TaxID=36148 RepID=A0A1B6KWT8_9HEMI